MQTVANRIKDLIGPDMDASLIASYEAIVNESFNLIAKAIPTTSILWQNEDTRQIIKQTPGWSFHINSADSLTVNNNKILKVLCKYPSQAVMDEDTIGGTVPLIDAMLIPYQEFVSGLNTNSLYYHGKSYNNPVFTITRDGYLNVSPNVTVVYDADNVASYPDSIIISYFRYFIENVSDYPNVSTLTMVQNGSGYPQEAVYAGCIKAAMSLLQARLSDATQDEEDMELQGLLNTQYETLKREFSGEMMKLVGDMAAAGGDNKE